MRPPLTLVARPLRDCAPMQVADPQSCVTPHFEIHRLIGYSRLAAWGSDASGDADAGCASEARNLDFKIRWAEFASITGAEGV